MHVPEKRDHSLRMLSTISVVSSHTHTRTDTNVLFKKECIHSLRLTATQFHIYFSIFVYIYKFMCANHTHFDISFVRLDAQYRSCWPTIQTEHPEHAYAVIRKTATKQSMGVYDVGLYT